jgi:hypothetical protein
MPKIDPSTHPQDTYFCQKCQTWWFPKFMKCLVKHPNDKCCHAGQTEVEMEETGKD